VLQTSISTAFLNIFVPLVQDAEPGYIAIVAVPDGLENSKAVTNELRNGYNCRTIAARNMLDLCKNGYLAVVKKP
jgi:hypothetical protein